MIVHPHSLEAERALLGGVLQEPGRLAELRERLRSEHFYRPDHATLYDFLSELLERDGTYDLVTLPQALERADLSARCGGLAYVLQLPDHAPSTANLDHYANVIQELAGLRQVLKVAEDLSRAAVSGTDPVAIVADRGIKALSEAAASGRSESWARISALIDEELVRIEQAAQGDDGVALPTGLDALTDKLGGMRPGQLLILAARPGMGKTALALNIAQSVSLLDHGPGVAIFSLEMTRHELVGRMLAAHAEIDARRLREGRLDEREWELLLARSEELRRTNLYVDDTPALSIGDLKARCRKLKADHPELGLIVIDYLQLMRGDDARAPRIQQVGEISQGLKALAKDVRVPVLALSQLNRGVESRQDKRPVLSDLRESGAIEQDADVILFIYRDDYYNEQSETPGQAEVIIAKQRAGSTGTVRLVWQAHVQRFADLIDGPPLQL